VPTISLRLWPTLRLCLPASLRLSPSANLPALPSSCLSTCVECQPSGSAHEPNLRLSSVVVSSSFTFRPISDLRLRPTLRLPCDLISDLRRPFRKLRGKKFGVEQEANTFRCLNPQFVSLPFYLQHLPLDCGLFRQEPAIARFDGLFTPYPKLEEQLHLEPLRTSTASYGGFILPWVRSPGFGSHSSNSRHFRTAPLIACGLVAFATDSLGRLSSLLKCTPWHVIQNARRNFRRDRPWLLGFRFFSLPVKGSFQHSLAVLIFLSVSRRV
jgi:hypothetical protein